MEIEMTEKKNKQYGRVVMKGLLATLSEPEQDPADHELIILALEQLRDGSYSPERRERCQGLIEEMKGEQSKSIR